MRIQSSVLTLSARSKDGTTNPRGIPYAPFVDKVEDYVTSRAEVEETLKSFQEMISYVRSSYPPELPPDTIFNPSHASELRVRCGYTDKYLRLNRKYQFMEVNTQRRAAGLKDKIPDIQKTLDVVRFLKTRKVCENIYSPSFPFINLRPLC